MCNLHFGCKYIDSIVDDFHLGIIVLYYFICDSYYISKIIPSSMSINIIMQKILSQLSSLHCLYIFFGRPSMYQKMTKASVKLLLMSSTSLFFILSLTMGSLIHIYIV